MNRAEVETMIQKVEAEVGLTLEEPMRSQMTNRILTLYWTTGKPEHELPLDLLKWMATWDPATEVCEVPAWTASEATIRSEMERRLEALIRETVDTLNTPMTLARRKRLLRKHGLIVKGENTFAMIENPEVSLVVTP